VKKIIGYILAFFPVWGALLTITIISPKIGLIVIGGVIIVIGGVILAAATFMVGICLINDDWPWSNQKGNGCD
jgi:hypothetical protein